MFAASLVLSIVASQWKPTAAFYLLPTRGWELAAGGLAFLIGREVVSLQKYSKPLLWSGFGLWVLAIVLLDSGYAWPSGWALLPVMGTVLIILANQTQAKLTVNPAAQWLGDRSYSLYLWHWPLVVALYFAGLQNDWLWVSGAIVLSLVLAHLSYHLVEVPTRSYLTTASLRKEIFAIALAGLVIGLAAVSVRLFTFENRLPAEVEIAAAEAKNEDPRKEKCSPDNNGSNPPKCIYGHNTIAAAVFGDSHARATISAVGEAAKVYNYGVLDWGKSSCPTILDLKYDGPKVETTRSRAGCANYLSKGLQYLKKEHSGIPLISISRTSGYIVGPNELDRIAEREQTLSSKYFDHNLKQLTVSACEIQKERQVYLVRPIPEMGVDVPKTLSRNIMLRRGNEDIKITLDEYHQRHKLVWEAQDQAAEQCGVKILDPLPYLCDDHYCYGSRNGRPLYYDDDHLSEYGNKFLVPMFEQVFRDQLATD